LDAFTQVNQVASSGVT